MTVGENVIPYVLVRKNVKNVNFRIRPDSTVIISANKGVPFEFIEQLVKKKSSWIIKNIQRCSQKQSKNRRQFVTGEALDYLGSRYCLHVIQVKKNEEVIIDGEKVFMFVKDESDFARKEKLFNRWYKDLAREVFEQSLERIYPLVAVYGIAMPSVTVRKMKTRWGSCSWQKQKITLNTELLKAAEACVDYVILHELTHFKHQNHDTLFYGFLSRIMPDWQERRNALKNIVIE